MVVTDSGVSLHGYTPAFLNHSRELNGPHSKESRHPASAATPETRNRLLKEAYEIVHANLARAFQCQAKYYNLRLHPWKPEIGEKVWKRLYPLSNKSDAFNAKLAPKFIGPLEVWKIPSPVIVDFREQKGEVVPTRACPRLKTNGSRAKQQQGSHRG